MKHLSIALASLLSFAGALTPTAEAQNLDAQLVASGLQRSVFMTTPPGETSRLFIIEQSRGTIKIAANGILMPTPFLDLGDIVGQGGTQGLVSMAFHPDYQNNGRFFVIYHDLLGDGIVAEYNVSSTDPNVADPNEVAIIVGPILQPAGIHNVDHLAFGPDGMLYVSTGDGGVGPLDTNNEAQDLQSILGKLLRFDVDLPAPYIPVSNPFVGDPNALDSIYAYGLRQPWRFSFDRLTGDFLLADVGEALREEINFVPAGTLAGKNFGWSCLEGTRCTGTNFCDCLDSSLVTPIRERQHAANVVAIIGGYVYRGNDIPSLQGTYFYSDYLEGAVRSLRYSGGQLTDEIDYTSQLDPGGSSTFEFFSSFGEDSAGEMYIVSLFGDVFKIVEGGGPDPAAITVACHGDGGDQAGCTDCPCGNNNTQGLPGGCLNSAGLAAELKTAGSISSNETTLNFDVEGARPSTLAILISAQALLPLSGGCPPGTGILGMPAMDGLRCVGFGLLRHGGRQTDANGDTGVTTPHWGRPDPPFPGIIAQGGFISGQTRGFQVIYRDTATLGCMTGLNTSNAISITFGL